MVEHKQGPCAKQTVTCTIVSKNGLAFTGTNYCNNPQKECPRGDMPSGEGYHLCKEICQQEGHAEEIALRAMKEAGESSEGAVAYVEGHVHICGNCQRVLKEAGLREWKIGKPELEETNDYNDDSYNDDYYELAQEVAATKRLQRLNSQCQCDVGNFGYCPGVANCPNACQTEDEDECTE